MTIFAGGNEINTITAALGGGAGASDQAGYIDAQVKAFGADYTTLLNGIRGRAGSARIVALNVPNLAGFPFLAQASLAQRQAAQRAAVGMTKTVVNALVSQNVTVVDVMCDSRMYLPSNFLFGRVSSERRRLCVHRRRNRARRHVERVSGAAERLRLHVDCPEPVINEWISMRSSRASRLG